MKYFAGVALDVYPRAQSYETFDAMQVNWGTVHFGPGGATEVHGRVHTQNVYGDGDIDNVLHLNPQHTDIVCGDIESMLAGGTFGGEAFVGTDAIVTVECECKETPRSRRGFSMSASGRKRPVRR